MLIPVILSGGAGTRLWPISREAHPKPFMRLPDGEGLLQKTLKRSAQLAGVSKVLTITNRDYYFHTRDEYAEMELGHAVDFTYILEPCGRNTAPAIAMAALVLQQYEDAMMLVLPADHMIEKQQAFATAVASAVDLAQQDYLVTFGIQPNTPETGYGYIKKGKVLDKQQHTYAVASFVEKPNLATANEYLESGDYLWNSGMFCFKPDAYLRALEASAPEMYAAVIACWEASEKNVQPTELNADCFSTIPADSIDYAVMEKADAVAVVACDIGWSDVGSWDAISALSPADDLGNRMVGGAMMINTRNTYIHSEDRLVATLGVEDLIIVDTPDALLISDRDHVQDVKKIVEKLKADGNEIFRYHRTVHRPWGTYTTLEEGYRFKIKRIVVKPGSSLSLQMHHHRNEHWIVVSGTAEVVNGEESFLLHTNHSTYIPAGHQHRLSNPGICDLVMIEVQSGEYLGEDDIVRFEDVYGRA
jgi:mannose-1-phosphate guanylyltransferase/mannose-6-phosphate isomerase